jgi:hypothetical protein
MDEETAANPQIRRSLLPVALSNRRNISSSRAMSMFQTSFLIRSDGLKSKLSGGCAISLFASDEPACCCSSSSPLSCACASCSLPANFLSLSRYLSRLAEPHLILVCKVALSPSLVIISLSLLWSPYLVVVAAHLKLLHTCISSPSPSSSLLIHIICLTDSFSCLRVWLVFLCLGKYKMSNLLTQEIALSAVAEKNSLNF